MTIELSLEFMKFEKSVPIINFKFIRESAIRNDWENSIYIPVCPKTVLLLIIKKIRYI